MVPRLRGQGWVASDVTVAPDATVRVDLTVGEELLRASAPLEHAPRRRHRRRRAAWRCARAASRRSPGSGRWSRRPPAGRSLWPTRPRQLRGHVARVRARHCVRLLLVEHQGELLAASLVIAFGDTTTYKMGGAWSGHPELRAKRRRTGRACAGRTSAAIAYHDFDGITRALAERVVAGEETIGERGGVDHYKLGFGGEVVAFPRTIDRSFHPLSPGIDWLAPRVPPHEAGRPAPAGTPCVDGFRTGCERG